MQNLPQVGKIYISQTDPTDQVYIERIDVIEADGDEPEGFCVVGCAPKDVGTHHADGIEIFGDEWIENKYQLSIP